MRPHCRSTAFAVTYLSETKRRSTSRFATVMDVDRWPPSGSEVNCGVGKEDGSVTTRAVDASVAGTVPFRRRTTGGCGR
jgi:hypothetical protein